MSGYPTEVPVGQDQAQADPGLTDPGTQMGQAMARYTIHIPRLDNEKEEIPHVLGAARQALQQAGFDGRTVIPNAQGDWQDYDTEEMALVMVDTDDTPENLQAILQVAAGVKELAKQEAVYVTKTPVETYLV
jgi:hypothetical protein